MRELKFTKNIINSRMPYLHLGKQEKVVYAPNFVKEFDRYIETMQNIADDVETRIDLFQASWEGAREWRDAHENLVDAFKENNNFLDMRTPTLFERTVDVLLAQDKYNHLGETTKKLARITDYHNHQKDDIGGSIGYFNRACAFYIVDQRRAEKNRFLAQNSL